MTKTYSRQTWDDARKAWDVGRFGSEWEPERMIAAERGYLYPPGGDPDDDRDAEHPSQRAIIYQAMTDTPVTLRAAVSSSRSWGEVVEKIIHDRTARSREVSAAEVRAARAKADAEDRTEAADVLARIRSGGPGYHHGGS